MKKLLTDQTKYRCIKQQKEMKETPFNNKWIIRANTKHKHTNENGTTTKSSTPYYQHQTHAQPRITSVGNSHYSQPSQGTDAVGDAASELIVVKLPTPYQTPKKGKENRLNQK